MRVISLAYLASILASFIILQCAIAAPLNDSIMHPNSTGLIENGFHPQVNGFSFENYGSDIKTVDLTPVEMGQMFGDKVFASTAGGKYVLTYPAERWMDETISAMESGHCEGMAVLSNLIYYGLVSPADFGGDEAANLSIQSELLQRQIGHWWATQLTSPGDSSRISKSPGAVIKALEDAFRDGRSAKEWWVMGIYMPDGSSGHSITPFAVQDLGNDTSRILVYDNNWPKDVRAVEVDTKANTWRYQASINPNEPSTLYTGNSTTQTLEIVSISPRLVPQACDFCDDLNDTTLNNTKGGQKEQKRIQVWQDGRARVLVTDRNGLRTGTLAKGEDINEIPNAQVRNLKYDSDSRHPPVIFLPAQLGVAPDMKVIVSSADSNDDGDDADSEDTTILAPGMAVAFSNPNTGPAQEQIIDMSPTSGGYIVCFSTSQSASPTITIDTSHQQIMISGANIEPGGSICIEVNKINNTLSMATKGNINPGIMRINLSLIDQNSGDSSIFGSSRTYLQPGDVISLGIADPAGSRGIPSIAIDHADGSSEKAGLIAIVPSDKFKANDLGLSAGRMGKSSLNTVWPETGDTGSDNAGSGSQDTSVPGTSGSDTSNPGIGNPGRSTPRDGGATVSTPGTAGPDIRTVGTIGPRTRETEAGNVYTINPSEHQSQKPVA